MKKNLKIWTNNQFGGHWPVPTAAIVIAKTAKEAAELLTLALKERGLEPALEEEMRIFAFEKDNINILSDGEY